MLHFLPVLVGMLIVNVAKTLGSMAVETEAESTEAELTEAEFTEAMIST